MNQLQRALGLAAVALSGTVAAQTLPSGALEEVVVTAQKRTENLQSVPLSMTTFGSVALEQKAITSFFDYGTKVPNLAFAPTGDGVGTARTVSIRGISGDNVTGFYIDETPLPDSIDPRVLDIDHIEVLRGPQGTLYGARSMGGTVRVITKQPDLNLFDTAVHAAVSKTSRAEDANWTGDGVVNIPLIQDHMALRLSGFYDQEAGYFKRSYCTDPATVAIANPTGTCTPLATSGITTVKKIGQIDSYGGAASLTIKASDALTITPRIMLQRASYNGFPMADYLSDTANGIGYPVPTPVTGAPLPTVLKPADFTQARWYNVPEGGYDSWGLYSVGLRWKTGSGELISSTAYFDRKVFESEDETDYIFTLTGNPQPGGISELKDYQRFVQEVRYASDLKGPMQFVLGAFYSDFHGRLPFASYYPPAQVPGLDNAFGGINNPDNIPNLVFAQDYHTTIKEPALFGELSYKASDALKLTAGLRWYEVRTSAYGYLEGAAAAFGIKTVDAPTTTTENGVNPKAQVDYHVTPDHMIYALAAKGFRPGGLVPSTPAGIPGSPTQDCAAALKAIDPNLTLDATRRFKSDSLWNYEIGAKTQWLDRRLTVNAAAFYVRWKNIQQEILLSCGFQYRANAGAAESKGGEIEMHARPVEPLDLSLGVGYQDAKITEASSGGAISPQQPGSPIYQVPDWTANASLTYTAALNEGWTLVSGLDWAHVGRSFSGNNSPANPRERAAYDLIDARFALAHGSLELALVGKNLSNEAANLGDSRSIAAEVPGRPRLFVNQPRTIGLEFRAHF